jgi:hypothetical protein
MLNLYKIQIIYRMSILPPDENFPAMNDPKLGPIPTQKRETSIVASCTFSVSDSDQHFVMLAKCKLVFSES